MLSTYMKGWVGTGLKNKCQQWQTAKQQLKNNTEHMTQKTNPWAQAPEVCEKAFFHLFRSSASGKYNFSSSLLPMPTLLDTN